ncbi:SusC/RagA family TonB-linked outer membrane protein [Hymenobacter negativus]|uniref:SusC/RagA family TonB-linked outer membrane protein n=1 Tax=Hymenobacter negativus TaxID=2795026 RepID=A0ABS3QCT5_9BACT|nr:SusC/RagA family TonB-linked outer membrane protein [Hymenobacter negativus]MBO2008783.1 SusC/RagA family TonB-linked outer membrane protein [Hymenobacter negativus]
MKNKLLGMVLLLLLGSFGAAWAQDRTVSGRVIDRATNEGLPGVTVLVPGTTVGAATNADGSFSISVPGTATELRFSSVGYVGQQQSITNGNGPYTVSLATDTKQLNEVVVTALGIEKDKKTLGYSTQTIEAGQLTQGRDRSVLNSLQGKVAGVQINSASGSVGSSTRVVIRGNKSFTGNNQPLYVVDGIPIDNSQVGTGDNLNNGVDTGNRANDINPEDVESVSILKGPAATALYGSRAATGAIIITTKSGRGAAKNGRKAEVTFTSSYVIDDILMLPKMQNEFGQGYPQDGYTRLSDTRENTSWGPRFDGVDRVWGNIIGNQQRSKPYVALPDNIREFFDLGKTWNNTISLGGGDAKTNYIVSASNVQQSGITPGTKYNRSSVKVGGETHLTNKIISSVSATYTNTSSDQAVTGQGYSSIYDQLIQTPRDISLLELRDINNKFNDINGYYSPYTVNPWQILHDNKFQNSVDRLVGNAQIGYQLNDHLKANYRLGIDTYSDQRSQFTARRDPTTAGYPTGTGYYAEDQLNYTEVNSDVIITYNGTITPDLTISALVGQNFNQRGFDGSGVGTNNLVSNSIGATLNNNKNNGYLNTSLTHNLRRLVGVYSTVDLGFRDYLFLGLTARNDWSSTLPANNRSFFYPAVNVGFVFTDLLGLKENRFFNYGKLRANVAQVGNDAPVYQTRSVFNVASVTNGYTGGVLQFPLGNVVGYSQSNTIGSNTLQPEITKSLEVGTELRFFNSRLTADVSLYDTRSTKQILTIPLPPGSGFTGLVGNVGEIQNKGIEVLLSGTAVKAGAFTWDLSLNYSKNVSKVLATTPDGADVAIGGFGTVSLTARVGEPYGVFLSTDILKNDAGQVVVSPTTGTPLTSQIKAMGTITPRYTAGLSSTFAYKGLALTVVVDTKQGGSMYSRTRATQRFAGTAPETLINDRQPFIVPNSVVQNSDGTYSPNTTPTDAYNYFGALEGASGPAGVDIIDASYTKLREVSLSYTLPSKWLTKTPFGNLSVGITGRNLLLWTAKENTYVDPEINNFGNGNVQGFDFTGSPSLRSYGANIRVSF